MIICNHLSLSLLFLSVCLPHSLPATLSISDHSLSLHHSFTLPPFSLCLSPPLPACYTICLPSLSISAPLHVSPTLYLYLYLSLSLHHSVSPPLSGSTPLCLYTTLSLLTPSPPDNTVRRDANPLMLVNADGHIKFGDIELPLHSICII